MPNKLWDAVTNYLLKKKGNCKTQDVKKMYYVPIWTTHTKTFQKSCTEHKARNKMCSTT